MKKTRLCVLGLAASLGLTGSAHATLIGLTQSYPDVSLNNTYLIYDNNAVDSNTGLLKVVSFGSTLSKDSVLNGGSSVTHSVTQLYTSSTDHTPDTMLTIAIRRSNGNWYQTNATGVNEVTIDFGQSTSGASFSWQGQITNFGWDDRSGYFGKQMDATWTMDSDQYVNMPSDLSNFVDGMLTSAMASFEGGINISNSAGFTNMSNPWQRDWVFGGGVSNKAIQNLLTPYLKGLANQNCGGRRTSNCFQGFIDSNVFADVFVPVPPAAFLWAGALATLVPSMRRMKNNKLFLKECST